jgi:hypothetical protein
MHSIILTTADSPRAQGWATAAAALGLPAPRLVTYGDVLAGRVDLTTLVTRDCVVRLDSFGRDWPLERALLALGADAIRPPYARISATDATALAFDKGRILYPHQAYLGYGALLDQISAQLAACPPHRLVQHPAEIKIMFDKPQTQALLAARGVPIPPPLWSDGPLWRWADLAHQLRGQPQRLFIKLANGSSAAGVAAYRSNGTHVQLITTIEAVPHPDGLRLYNTRQLQTLEHIEPIHAILQTLTAERVHVESWIPKARYDGQMFDLRVLVIAGRAAHVVPRLSHTPITNLHLLNTRGDRTAVQAHVTARAGADAWAHALACAEQAAACFPRSVHCGVDVLLERSMGRAFVCEVNAFGDLLHGITHNGDDPYTAEWRALLAGA